MLNNTSSRQIENCFSKTKGGAKNFDVVYIRCTNCLVKNVQNLTNVVKTL